MACVKGVTMALVRGSNGSLGACMHRRRGTAAAMTPDPGALRAARAELQRRLSDGEIDFAAFNRDWRALDRPLSPAEVVVDRPTEDDGCLEVRVERLPLVAGQRLGLRKEEASAGQRVPRARRAWHDPSLRAPGTRPATTGRLGARSRGRRPRRPGRRRRCRRDRSPRPACRDRPGRGRPAPGRRLSPRHRTAPESEPG